MLRSICVLFLAVTATMPAQAALRVFACEPEWQALAQELGGSEVEAFSDAGSAPHRRAPEPGRETAPC